MPARGTPLKNVGEKLKFSVVEDGYCTVSVFFRYTSIGIGKDEVRLLRVKYHIFIVNDDVSGIRLDIVCKPRCNFHPFAVSHSRINVRKIGGKQPFITDRRWSDVYHAARKMPLLPHLLHGFQPQVLPRRFDNNIRVGCINVSLQLSHRSRVEECPMPVLSRFALIHEQALVVFGVQYTVEVEEDYLGHPFSVIVGRHGYSVSSSPCSKCISMLLSLW